MSNRELIVEELERFPDEDLGRILTLLRSWKDERAESHALLLLAESAFAKDWLSPEEDAAWAHL